MLMKVVGVQEQDYKLENGYSFKGAKIHAIDLETVPQGLTGNMVTDFKIPADHPLYQMPLRVGGIYKCYFTQKGALDFMAECSDKDLEKGGKA
jgi:hypothetical protein